MYFGARIFEEIPLSICILEAVFLSANFLNVTVANRHFRGLYSVVRSKAFKRASALVSKRMSVGKKLERFDFGHFG